MKIYVIEKYKNDTKEMYKRERCVKNCIKIENVERKHF